MEERETRHTKILAYFLCQATGNDYGSNFLLIIEDISKRCGFVSAFRYLKSKRIYKVLLAQPVVPDFKLLGSVNLVWLWSSMSLGEEDFVIFHTTVRNKEEEDYSDCKDSYVAAKIVVFWDMDGCKIP